MQNESDNNIIITNNWLSLKQYTAARIALGRTGISVPAKEMLQFKMAHAHAKDAVFSAMNTEWLLEELKQFQLPVISLKSKASNRFEYLQRPDFGRRLHQDSLNALQSLPQKNYDVCIVIADGLSAEAVNKNALPLLRLLIPQFIQQQKNIAPICLAEQGRVAIGDEIGFALNASTTIMLIGERPGLSAPDSLGIYITHKPTVGLTDESRKCISNVREGGLSNSNAVENVLKNLNINDELISGHRLHID